MESGRGLGKQTKLNNEEQRRGREKEALRDVETEGSTAERRRGGSQLRHGSEAGGPPGLRGAGSAPSPQAGVTHAPGSQALVSLVSTLQGGARTASAHSLSVLVWRSGWTSR